jgi:hypothetical protein
MKRKNLSGESLPDLFRQSRAESAIIMALVHRDKFILGRAFGAGSGATDFILE